MFSAVELGSLDHTYTGGMGDLEFSLLWTPVAWEATEEPGFLGEEAALVPKPVLDGAGLLDGMQGVAKES